MILNDLDQRFILNKDKKKHKFVGLKSLLSGTKIDSGLVIKYSIDLHR
ncbi:MAG: hypothetical protein HC817_13190 [Saprospiraceae bacterium]|nr:hypothetical protein [Saprospiraceae bacterium]